MSESLVAAAPAALSLVRRPAASVGPLEIRVAVAAAGICHTDFYLLDGSHPGASYPRVPGHEFSGIVTGIGADVPGELPVGTRVAVLSTLACGRCEACLSGRPARCSQAQHLGTDRDGGWQHYVDVPWFAAVPVPDQVSLVEAALFEPAANAHAALAAGCVGKDDHVVVIGPGAIGILTALLAAQTRPRSLAVLGLDVDAERLAVARRIVGAEVSPTDGAGRTTAMALLSRATVVMQCAPSLAATSLALERLQDGGRLVVEGYAGDTGTLPLGADELCVRSLQLIGVNGWTRHDFESVAALAATRQIDLSEIPVMHFSLREHDAAVRAAHDNRAIMRVMFQPNG